MSPASLTRETTIRAAESLVAAELDAEVVILSMREGIYFGLDGVGSRIWALVQAPTTLGAIAATLVREFDVDEPTAYADLVRLASEMSEHGLVVLE